MQAVIVALLVAGAALYLGARLWRSTVGARRAERDGCASGCGCGSDPARGKPHTGAR